MEYVLTVFIFLLMILMISYGYFFMDSFIKPVRHFMIEFVQRSSIYEAINENPRPIILKDLALIFKMTDYYKYIDNFRYRNVCYAYFGSVLFNENLPENWQRLSEGFGYFGSISKRSPDKLKIQTRLSDELTSLNNDKLLLIQKLEEYDKVNKTSRVSIAIKNYEDVYKLLCLAKYEFKEMKNFKKRFGLEKSYTYE